MATGLFSIRGGRGGPRPCQHAIAREAALDARVAEELAAGVSLRRIAEHLRITRSTLDASYRRICMRLGDQAR